MRTKQLNNFSLCCLFELFGDFLIQVKITQKDLFAQRIFDFINWIQSTAGVMALRSVLSLKDTFSYKGDILSLNARGLQHTLRRKTLFFVKQFKTDLYYFFFTSITFCSLG